MKLFLERHIRILHKTSFVVVVSRVPYLTIEDVRHLNWRRVHFKSFGEVCCSDRGFG